VSEITVSVNGQPRAAASGATVSDLLVALDLDAKSVLVELNETVLQRHEYPQTVIQDGDHLEFIRVVAGG
jgi:thiamine biosynthesis protein ThiS